MIKTVGSVCSGIEAASVAWLPYGAEFKWFSEIAPFPSRILKERYPAIPNLGDMAELPERISRRLTEAPDLICGGTPCQAFSLAGNQNGLNDDRGNLTLKFADIADASDAVRLRLGKPRSVIFWENVEGVLSDKTNAFGCFISRLAGLETPLVRGKWPCAGILYGSERNVAWRVFDAKFFGIPQQRRRLYVIAGGKEFRPETVLFEKKNAEKRNFYSDLPLSFEKDGCRFEFFRAYTDCLYASYGTKWNGNAAAMNGSLFVVQDGRIRRFSPRECERLMGFPDGYTDLKNSKKTSRYQALGNSWAVPVVRWLGDRIFRPQTRERIPEFRETVPLLGASDGEGFVDLEAMHSDLNVSEAPMNCVFGNLYDIVDPDASEDIYISPVGCHGILRRSEERALKINSRLETVLSGIAATMSSEEIERKSMVQKRGRFSKITAQQMQLNFQ